MTLTRPALRSSLRGSPGDADFELAALGSALWRQRFKILGPTIAVALITFLIVLMIPAKYQSEARILLMSRDNVYLRPDADKDIMDRNVVDQEAVVSQAQLVMSRDLAREVIAKLKLNELPEFDPTLSGVSLVKSLLGFLGVIKNPMSMSPEERVLEAYYDRLSVFPVEKSRVIVIDFLSENPELAARVANAVADAYLERQQAAKQDQARTASAWLSGEVDQMRKKVADAEAKVEAFRNKSNLLVGPNNTTLSNQQLADLNAQLAIARAQKADAEAKAKIIRGLLKSGETIESSDILNSELIRRLSEQRVTLRAQLAEQSSSLLANHPRIKELKAQIEDLDQQIRKEAETIARSFENDAKLAEARVESQLATFDQAKSQAATSNEDDVQLRALEREAKAQRDLLESYLAKYREASARDAMASAPPDARVISQATVSNVPAYPKKLPTVLIAAIATMVLCSGMVLTRELLAEPGAEVGEAGSFRRRARRIGRGEAVAAGPADDAAPATARRTAPDAPASAARRAASAPKGPPVGFPVSAIEEFAGNLRDAEVAGTQMAFFAAGPDLDTSRIALKFARALSREGRVVLVSLGSGDAALKAISTDPDAPGLAELAAGIASFGDIITRDQASSVNLITWGRTVAARGVLLSSSRMAANFRALALTYAHVVIDAGRLGESEVSDVARLATRAVLVVQTLSNLAAARARDNLLDAGFEDVTILVAGRGEAGSAERAAPDAPPAAAA